MTHEKFAITDSLIWDRRSCESSENAQFCARRRCVIQLESELWSFPSPEGLFSVFGLLRNGLDAFT